MKRNKTNDKGENKGGKEAVKIEGEMRSLSEREENGAKGSRDEKIKRKIES